MNNTIHYDGIDVEQLLRIINRKTTFLGRNSMQEVLEFLHIDQPKFMEKVKEYALNSEFARAYPNEKIIPLASAFDLESQKRMTDSLRSTGAFEKQGKDNDQR